jgi:hypothetical protein
MNTYKQINTKYFCNHILNIGDPVFGIDDRSVSDIKHCPPGSRLLGISLNNIVDIDFSKCRLEYNYVRKGGIINILESGTFVKELPKEWKLPIGQNIYVSKDGKLTWRRETDIYLGITSSYQDEDGFVKITIGIK